MRLKSKVFDFETEDYEKLSSSQLKRQADYWLRKYLLKNTDSNGNRYFCPLKERWFSAEQMHVAHFIDRSSICTRYDLDNCHLISSNSNTFDAQVQVEGFKSLHHKEYSDWLGEEKVKQLIEKSKQICLYYPSDYIEIIKKFRE